MNEKKLHFSVKSGLKNILGREMITNEVVAIFELVKNSCDANARNVYIEFDKVKNVIVISDDGVGMSSEDIISKWLSLAYSFKSESMKNDTDYYAGSKGIGRLACDRLGSKLKLRTTCADSDFYSIIEVDWDNFEKDPSGSFEGVDLLYSETSKISREESGTVIEISNIRDKWDSKQLLKLESSLSKLINPFEEIRICNIHLIIKNDDLLNSVENKVINNNVLELLKDKTTMVICEFYENIVVELIDRGKKIYKVERLKNDTLLENIKIQVFYLNRKAKYTFTSKMGNQRDYGSIFVYKNGFRVFPYGEIDFDPFGLDTRKTQGMMRYIGNRELLGCISINDNKGHFIEISSRDGGFQKNIYVKELNDAYLKFVHRPLEKFVNFIKWGYDLNTDTEIFFSDTELKDEHQILPSFLDKKKDKWIVFEEVKIDKNIISDLDKLDDNNDLSNDEKVKIVKQSKAIIKEQQKVISRLEKVSLEKESQIKSLENQSKLLKNMTENEIVLQSEITHHISKMSLLLSNSCEDLNKIIKSFNIPTEAYLDTLSDILYVSERLKVFNNIILKGNFSAKNPILVNLLEYFEFYINNSSTISSYKLDSLVVSRSVDSAYFYKVDVYDISVMIDNFVVNTFELGGTFIQFEFIKQNNSEWLEIFSNTPHVAIENIDKIFQLGFSTKKGGTGIGLYQIRTIVESYFDKINVENVEKGVKFVIKLK